MQTVTKTKWALDTAHSEIGFKVKHMMITNVSGAFSAFGADVETEGDDFSTATITFSADLDSLSTGSPDRDNHLKSADFFDAASHPKLTFKSTRMEKLSASEYQLFGDLTIRGVTHPVVLDVEFGGVGKDPFGNQKAGFTVSGKISRGQFGLNWNASLETGGVLVSDEVRLFGDVQLIRQA